MLQINMVGVNAIQFDHPLEAKAYKPRAKAQLLFFQYSSTQISIEAN